MSIIEIILSSNTAYVLLLYLISAKVQSRRFKETISHTLTKNVILVLHILVCTNTAGNRHKQNSWFCKEIREYNFRFW